MLFQGFAFYEETFNIMVGFDGLKAEEREDWRSSAFIKICDLRGLIAGKAYHSLNWTNSAENNLPSFGEKPKEKKPPSLLSLLL
jgi:hypothetical protein